MSTFGLHQPLFSYLNRAVVGTGRPSWIARASTVAFAAVLLTACGSPEPGDAKLASEKDVVGSESSAIYGGIADTGDTASDAVVAIAIGASSLCSGTLIAPNVVLTARHCVTDVAANKKTIVCDKNGASATGPQLASDFPPSSLAIFSGATTTFSGPVAARGKAIFHPKSDVLCNDDIALIVLDTPITNVAPIPIRRAATTVAGETFRAVGYGINDVGKPLGTRLHRLGVRVLALGAGVSARGTALGSRELEVSEGACGGDSGGPAISERTGAVIGIVSRGTACGSASGLIYTSTAAFDDVFEEAFNAAGGAPVDEASTIQAFDASEKSSDGSDNSFGDVTSDGLPRSASTSRPNFARLTSRATGGCSVAAPSGAAAGFASWLAASICSISLVSRRRRSRRVPSES
jgi:hypothetical protein